MYAPDIRELATNAISVIQNSIEPIWQNMDIFNLDEPVDRPLPDDKVGKADFKARTSVNPTFPFDIFYKHLAKLEAGTEYMKRHHATYVFSDKNMSFEINSLKNDLLGDTCSERVVNINHISINLFIDCLIQLSKEHTFNYHSYPDKKDIIQKTRIFLIGKPGTGKTTFLNYLLSVYEISLVIPQKVMIIRVNLGRYENRKANFQNFILEKFYHVYRNFFWKKKYYRIDLNKFKEKIIEERGIENNKNKIKELDEQIDNFTKNVDKVLDYSFLADMMKYLTDTEEISYIFFFDGLDYVTLAEVHNKIFKQWTDEVVNYLYSKRSFRGSYVIAMRDVSFDRAIRNKLGETANIYKTSKRVKVNTCDFQKVIRKKLLVAKDEIEDLYFKRSRKDQAYKQEFGWLNEEFLKRIIEDFLTFISVPFITSAEKKISKIKNYRQLKERIHDDGCKAIEKITSGNYRCAMRNIRYVIHHFINAYRIYSYHDLFKKTKIQDRLRNLNSLSYRVLRTFITGLDEAEDYRPPYSYKLVRGKVEFIKNGSRFIIPHINNFVFIPKKIYDSNTQYRGMFKLRLLQYLINIKRKIIISKVLDFFEENFDYERRYIKRDIEEMIYSQLIDVHTGKKYEKDIDALITTTDLARFILNKLIYHYIYYESTIDSLPMPITVSSCIKPYNLNWQTVSLAEYVIEKARYSLFYLKFLQYSEANEMKRFEKIQSDKLNSKERIKFNKYFRFFSNLVERNRGKGT